MRSALAAANYKLQIMPPEDVIVGEKSFASRFVLEALNELYDVTNGIEKEIFNIEDVSKEEIKLKKVLMGSDKWPFLSYIRCGKLFITTI